MKEKGKVFIIIRETVTRNEFPIMAKNMEEAASKMQEIADDAHRVFKEDGYFLSNNYYIREVSEPESANRKICSIPKLSDEEAIEVAAEMCAMCDKDCKNCPLNGDCEEDKSDIDDFDEENCECHMEEVMAYLSIICDQLESLTSLLEKVCKVSPEK